MAEITSLDTARRKRSQLNRALAENAVMHPSLRWTTTASTGAHRRTPTGETVCGLSGPLKLAHTDDRLCRDCYTVPVAPAS